MAAAGDCQLIRGRDLATGKEIGPLRGHYRVVDSVELSPDAKTLSSLGQDGTRPPARNFVFRDAGLWMPFRGILPCRLSGERWPERTPTSRMGRHDYYTDVAYLAQGQGGAGNGITPSFPTRRLEGAKRTGPCLPATVRCASVQRGAFPIRPAVKDQRDSAANAVTPTPERSKLGLTTAQTNGSCSTGRMNYSM